MRITFTGTQEGMTDEQKAEVNGLLRALKPSEVHHGDCVGADDEFHDIVKSLGIGIRIFIHPAIVARRKRAFRHGGYIADLKPPLVRNHIMINATDTVIAAPKEFEEARRSGTWATVRYGRKAGHKIYVVLPSGKIREERS